MNPIEIYQRINFYNNLTASARFTFAEISISVNDSMSEYIYAEMGDEEQRDPKNFQWNQRIRDNLRTLIKKSSPTITNGTTLTNEYYSSTPTELSLPADYNTFVELMVNCSGITSYARPTTYNELGPILESSFKHPKKNKYYYCESRESTTSLTLWRDPLLTVSSAILTYIKIADTFSIGSETQLISNTSTVLTNAAAYYATEVTVFNGVTYQIGATITGNGVNALTSGQVILASATTNCELPASVHERICKWASSKLLASIGMLQDSAAIEYQEKKG